MIIKNEFAFLGAYRTLPQKPWNPIDYFTTVRGVEFLQLYFWLLKDFAWTNDYYAMGLTFGALALFMTVWLIGMTIHYKNWIELWHYIATFIWLWGNYWWAYGELHDHEYPDDKPIYDKHTIDTSWILTSGLCWLGAYYLIILPFHLMPKIPDEVHDLFDECPVALPATVAAVFPYLRNVENLHILSWLGKDCAWAFAIQSMWIVFLIPTVVLSFIFVVVTSFQKHRFVSNLHYLVQFLWVIANVVWAYGELWSRDDDEPHNVFEFNSTTRSTFRWYSTWILFSGLLVICFIYVIWIPLTILGMTKDQQASNGGRHSA